MKKSTVFNMTSCALMAALMCVLCPVSVPIGPIPISLSILVILLTVYVLGTWRALVSYTVYLLLQWECRCSPASRAALPSWQAPPEGILPGSG